MESLKLSPLTKRVMTSFLLVPFVISVLTIGTPMFEICSILLGILFAWEWANMVPNKKKDIYLAAYSFAVAVAVVFPKSWALVVIVLTTAFVLYKARHEERKILLALGVPYISLGIGALVWIYQDIGLLFFFWVLFVVWGMDTGGYIVGSTLKGPKLMPKISPNKTWSGLIGGMIFSVIFGSIVIYYVEVVYKEVGMLFVSNSEYIFTFKGIYIVLGLYAMLCGFISQVGDLIESSIKRKVGVKDSSNLIPGHGGVFDRIDALVFVAPFVYLWFMF